MDGMDGSIQQSGSSPPPPFPFRTVDVWLNNRLIMIRSIEWGISEIIVVMFAGGPA